MREKPKHSIGQGKADAQHGQATAKPPWFRQVLWLTILLLGVLIVSVWYARETSSRTNLAGAGGAGQQATPPDQQSAMAGANTAKQGSPDRPRSQNSDYNAPFPADEAMLRDDLMRVVNELTARFPNFPDCLELKARTLDWLGEKQAARSDRDELRAKFDQAAQFYRDAGRLYAAGGLLAEAEDALRRATVVSPDDASSRLDLAALFTEQNRRSDAMGMLEQVANSRSEDADANLQLALAYNELSAWDHVEMSLERCCQLAPTRADGWTLRADFYLRRNEKLSEAVEFARKAVELAPTAPNYALLAAACDRTGNLADALAAINLAVEKAPESSVYRDVQKELQAALDAQE